MATTAKIPDEIVRALEKIPAVAQDVGILKDHVERVVKSVEGNGTEGLVSRVLVLERDCLLYRKHIEKEEAKEEEEVRANKQMARDLRLTLIGILFTQVLSIIAAVLATRLFP